MASPDKNKKAPSQASGEDVMVIRSKDGRHDLVLRPTKHRGVKIYVVKIPSRAPKPAPA